MGKRSTCCHIDTTLLLVVHVPQHSSVALLYVAPLLTYTELRYLIQIMNVLIKVSDTAMWYMWLGNYAKGFTQ